MIVMIVMIVMIPMIAMIAMIVMIDSPTGYGSHSLRRGGATAAAKAKVQMHVIKRHGRWASDAVYLYIVDGVEEQLGLSAAVLGSG
jgi:hypothetical protein